MNICAMSAGALGRAIQAKELDPIEICEAFLAAIDASEHRDTIYSAVTHERALREASAASKRQRDGTSLGPLDGVPVSWKDLFDTEDIETRAGSNLLAGRVPKKDCEVVVRATKAGMVCLGKTHMSELAFSGLGINPCTATPPNIYDHTLAPGGSSSGAGTSVAFDLAPIGIGSDTGGSVRIPSVWNGLVGLKTTHGAISLSGVVPLCASFDTVGPLCRNVEDAALMFEILSGKPVPKKDIGDLSSLRFLICETAMLDDCQPPQLAGFKAAVSALQDAGVTIERGAIPELDEMRELGPKMFPYEAYQQWGELIESDPDKMFPPVLNRFMGGKSVTAEQDHEARARMAALREDYIIRTKGYDAVLAPTTRIGAPLVEPLLRDHDLFWDMNMAALNNTRYANMFGLCALTLPTKVEMAGLMLMANGGQDQRLLQIGKLCEAVVRQAA